MRSSSSWIFRPLYGFTVLSSINSGRPQVGDGGVCVRAARARVLLIIEQARSIAPAVLFT